MKILILNSDSPNNRGDRAILQGNLKLIKNRWPDAEIWALSEHSERDEAWYGINFLPYSAYTISPLGLLKIALFSRKCDLVFWGGGEILKDYTNKIGIVYWLLRILSVRIFNQNIYGLFQGIGPTTSPLSKRLIITAVNMMKAFIVRDDESREKLETWGSNTLIISSFDPAIMNKANEPDKETWKLLKDNFDIDQSFLENSIGVGLRRWFHYKKGGFLPYKYRFWDKKDFSSNPKLDTYIENTAKLLDSIIKKHNVNVVFFPMFNAPPEGDDTFSKSIQSKMKYGEKARIIDQDILSPQQYENVTSKCRIFIAARLHSSIVAVSSGVPAVVFYYVDKGRLFFEQIGMTKYSQPIEKLLDDSYLATVEKQVDDILTNTAAVRSELNTNISAMRKKIAHDFTAIPQPRDTNE